MSAYDLIWHYSQLISLSLMQKSVHQQYQFQQQFQPQQLAVRHMLENVEQPAHTISGENESN